MNRHEEGFTLAEVLVALVVVSLTVASLLQVTGITAHGQKERAQFRKAERQIAQTLKAEAERLNAVSPLTLAKIEGDASGLNYPCGGEVCRLEAQIFASDARLIYASGDQAGPHWPPQVKDGAHPPRLETLIVEDRQGRTLGRIAIRAEQPLDCQFDSLSRMCREGEQP